MSQASQGLHQEHATRIWRAGVAAVAGERLIAEQVRLDAAYLHLGGRSFPRAELGRVEVVGAGKAGASMAAALEAALGPAGSEACDVRGWVNVPADCVRPLSRIVLHPARAAGRNEPAPEGVAGTREILRRVGSLGPRDVCVVLLSGGGSALLPAPAAGLTWEDKLAVTRFLSGAGADIRALNTVRKQLSAIKGGGLARACTAGNLVCLVISDVVGDPLDVIASGPTVPNPTTAADALAVLDRFGAAGRIPPSVFDLLREKAAAPAVAESFPHVTNVLVGTNARAVEAAAAEARRLGYATRVEHAGHEDEAAAVGERLADALLAAPVDRPRCLISGGEPIVTLPPAERRGRGGRNQQLVLAALARLLRGAAAAVPERGIVLSGGTDGEDGPTDAAGAFFDLADLTAMRTRLPEIEAALARCGAYDFFGPLGLLLMTGPTHTNVMDLRVVLSGPPPG